MNKFIIVISLLFATISLSYGQATSLSGNVTDQDSGKPILFGSVALYNNGKLITGVKTDFDGNYSFANIDPGTYDIEASYIGYHRSRITGIVVLAGKSNISNIEIRESRGVDLCEVVVIEYRQPLIEHDNTSQGTIVTSEEIKTLSTRSINGLATTSAGVDSGNNKDAPAIRSSRTEGTLYVVDGIIAHDSKVAEPKKDLPKAGQLTAGEWNDLTHWDAWKKLLENKTFADMQNHWNIFPNNRYPVFVTNKDNLPLANCKVELIAVKDHVIWQAYTDNGGSAELWSGVFGTESEVKEIRLTYKGHKIIIDDPTNAETEINHLEIPYECESNNEVEVLFVVDATGSMRDEIQYLRSEISDVINTVQNNEKEMKLKTGAVFYGDYETDFVTKTSPLSANTKDCISFIQNEDAVNGGHNSNFPEAVELGLEEALSMSWTETAHTKIIFLMLDAAAHHNEEVISILQAQIIQAASMGIKIIPVSASNLKRDGEFLLKFMALLTNGTYVFLTDDSGIGNAHLKPVHNEHKVETLNQLLIRLILNYSDARSCKDAKTREETMQSPRLFPNPANLRTKLKLSEKADLVTLHASSGRVVRTFQDVEKELKINCENLVAGIYTLCIYTGDKKETERLVVIRR